MPGMNKSKGKGAVSSLVATVILILIVINAVLVISIAVIPTIEDSIKVSNACTNARLSIDTTSGYTCYNESYSKASVVVARGPDEHELSGMLLGLEGNGSLANYIVKQQDPAIVLSFNFNEGSGIRATDSSGRGNDGNLEGTGWVSGKYGPGIEFDKPNESVTVSKSSSLEIIDNITIEAWIKIDSVKSEPVPDFVIGRG